MPRSLWVMIAASLGFGFVTATTFTSLGYVLYAMVAELGWSHAAAGSSFALLGLACGLASPLPPFLIKQVGSRLTLFIGAMVLAAGFLLASVVQGIDLFFVATALMGAGFSLIAPSPGVFLIATWLPERSARLLGAYFMAGSLGGVVGPLIVGAIVGVAGSWRLHWAMMGVAAIVLGLFFLFAVRDAVTVKSADQVKHAATGQVAPAKAPAWTVRQSMRSQAFLLITAAMLVVQTVVTTLHSVLVSHIAGIGGGAGAAAAGALAMSLLALTGTLAKGATGALAEKYDARRLLILGLALQFAAVTLLAAAQTPMLAILAALVFGIGWGLAWLSAHVLLLRYFGAALAADLTAMATMATTLAVLGPLSSGWVADRTGSFTPIFLIFAGLLAIVIVSTTLFLRAPRALPQPDVAQSHDDAPLLVPAE